MKEKEIRKRSVSERHARPNVHSSAVQVPIQQKAGESDGSYVDYHKRKDSGAEVRGAGAGGPRAAAAAAAPADDSDLFSGNGHVDASGEGQLESELTSVVPPAKAAPAVGLRTRSQKKSKRAE